MNTPIDLLLRKLRYCKYLYLGQTEGAGLGVFAARPFRRGETISADEDGDYFDRVLNYAALIAQGYDVHHDAVQIGIDTYVLPNGNLDDYMNHSCDPNCGMRLTEGGYLNIALRDIPAGAEITYDYSTYMNGPYEPMPCGCESARCRGLIGNFLTLPIALQKRYLALGVTGDFVTAPLDFARVA